MKISIHSGKRFRRTLTICLLAGAGLIVFQLLRAQSTPPAPASTNTSVPPTTNAVVTVPPLAAPNSTTGQGTNSPLSIVSPPATTNTSSTLGNSTLNSSTNPATTNTAPDQGTSDLNSPGATAQPGVGDTSEGLPGETGNPAVQDISNGSPDMSAGQSQGMPNSPAVQNISNSPSFLENFWQGGSPLHFALTAGETYDDNFLISPNKVGSFVTHVSPSIDFQKGDPGSPHMNYVNLYFAPGLFFYQNHSDDNRVDYNADAYYQYTWTRLTLGIDLNYQHLTDASLDIGSLVTRNIYSAKVNASYIVNDNLSLFQTASEVVSDYPGTTNKETDVDSYALYQLAPKLSVGAGPRFAFVDISNATDERHQDFLFRFRYLPGPRLSVGLDAGVEYLEFEDNTPSHIFPIFALNLNYEPTQGTDLFMTASRESISSYDQAGTIIVNDAVQGGVTQRFLQDFVFSLTLGYNMSDYEFGSNSMDEGDDGETARNDNYYFAKGAVEYEPNTWLKVEMSYQWSNNQSNFAQNSFSDNQVDIQSTVHF